MRLNGRILNLIVLAAALGLVACDDSGETDGAGGAAMGGTPMGGTAMGGTPMGGTPMGGVPMGGTVDDDTISYSGVAIEWLSSEPGLIFTVCQMDTEICTTTAEDGTFTLEGLPPESEIMLSFVGEDNARIAFPIVTGTEDMTARRSFTVVARGTADIMLALAGEPNGIDDTKGILTFYAGYADFVRGIPGIPVTYDGPDTEKPVSFIQPIADAPGVTVAGADVTATTRAGNGFVPNIAAGDYTVTFPNDTRTCTADFAWPGETPNTFRTRLVEGYATFTFVSCATDATVTSTGTLTEFGEETPLADAEICFNWEQNEDGTYVNTQCAQSDAAGIVTHTELPAESRILTRFSKDGYMNAVGTFELLEAEFTWSGAGVLDAAVFAAAALVGVVVDETKGHVVINVFNPEGKGLDGYVLTVDGGEQTAVYSDNGLFDTELTATKSGGAAILNLEPGDYTFNLEKDGVLCIPSPWSWSGGGYDAPIEANAITTIGVYCIDEPSALFGEPSEPIDPAMCVEGEAEANCVEVCTFFTECAYDLCDGLQELSEWESGITDAGFAAACETTCTETPEIVDTLCTFGTCNEALSLGVTTNDDFAALCANGWPNLLETAAQAAAAPDSVVTTVVELAASSEIAADLLANGEGLTVFLPVDAAFAALDAELLAAVGADAGLRDTVLSYHVIPMPLPAAAVVEAIDSGLTFVDTLGGILPIGYNDDGGVHIGGANVIGTDIFASNGVVHLIDNVILPPADLFDEPVPAIDAPMCVEDDIEASCDEACRQFVQCSNAVCPGRQGITEWESDIGNAGMWEGCREVCAEAPEFITERACNHTTCNETLRLVTYTEEGFDDFCADGFDTLAEVAGQAIEGGAPLATVGGLINDTPAVAMALEGDGPFTVFLPVDAAFELLDAELLDAVAADAELRATVLQHHAVDGGFPEAAVRAALADGLDSIQTLGGPISVAQDMDGNIVVGGATVIETDILASNGVIHLIDRVILSE